MITDSYDTSEPIISIDKMFKRKGKLCDICLITFSDKIIKHVESGFKCIRISSTPLILVFEYSGQKIGICLSSMGAPATAICLISAAQMIGATKFIMFGSAGSLNNEATSGKFVIPTEAYRDEGLSYHYMQASDYVEIKNSDIVCSVMENLEIPFVQGKIWTTDAFFMETKNKYKSHVEDGCLAVDMETSGIQAVCNFHGFELYSFLQPGDILSQDSYKKEGLAKANHQTLKFYLALEIAKRIS